MLFFEILGLGFVVIMAFMSAIWLISLAIKDSSIVDIFWGSGFLLAALVYFALTSGFETRKILLIVLVAVWGLRLSVHIGARNIGKGEDFRYRKWREQHGTTYWWVSFFRVYLLQGALMWVISVPLLVAQFGPDPARLTVFDVVGVGVWTIGFFFEAVGDWQLMRFKANPENKGKLMRSGLWKYTRHPNYFGDATVWWGFFLISLSVPGGFLAVFSPLLMTILLMKVSGVALLEQSLTRANPLYADYIRTTSAFFPLPPRNQNEEI